MKKRFEKFGIIVKSLFILIVIVFGNYVITAQEDVQIINKPEGEIELKKYSDLIDFMNVGEKPFGEINEKAPAETLQFGQLAGIWEIENTAWFQGKWYCCWRAAWGFKYILDGYGVQDYWMQLEEDLPPPMKQIARNSSLSQLRVYSKKDKKWSVSWISNGAGETGGSDYGRFEAFKKDDEMIMIPPKIEGKPLSRIIFYDIKKDSFMWRSEISEDEGKTWQPRTYIKATRIK